jgi:hypothetical protein
MVVPKGRMFLKFGLLGQFRCLIYVLFNTGTQYWYESRTMDPELIVFIDVLDLW